MKKLNEIIKESGLSRIWKHVTKHESGTISAARYAENCSNGTRYTRKDNKIRNAKLKNKLLSLGYGVTRVSGTYVENYGTKNAVKVKETSYIVIDLKDTKKLKKDLMKLGLYFEQDSITFSKPSGDYYLISTNKCPSGYPGNGSIGKVKKLGKPFFGKDGEFYSSINGRPFVFESIDYNTVQLNELSLSEIKSCILSSREWEDEYNKIK